MASIHCDRAIFELDRAIDAVYDALPPGEQAEMKQHYYQARSFLKAASIRAGVVIPNRKGRKRVSPMTPLKPVREDYAG